MPVVTRSVLAFYIASAQQKLAGYYQIITRWLFTVYKVSPTVITGITQAVLRFPCLINVEPWNYRLLALLLDLAPAQPAEPDHRVPDR